MKPELKSLIILALGLDAAADDAAIETALTTHLQKISDDKKSKEEPNKNKPPGEQAQPPPAANEQLDAAIADAKEQTRLMREGRIDHALDSAVALGLLAANERGPLRDTLLACANEKDLGTKLTELRNRKPVMQRQPLHAANLGGQRPLAAANEDVDRATKRTAAVNQILTQEMGYNLNALPDGARSHAWAIAAGRDPQLFSH